MSHMTCEVVIPPGDIKESIQQVMDSFKYEDEGPDWYDWWVIGGRFSGNKLIAQIDKEQLDRFYAALTEKKVTVSSFQCGKHEINPASQIPMVDALWRGLVPGKGSVCPLFNHAYDQYGKKGIYDDDVCPVELVPDALEATRLVLAGPHSDKEKSNILEAKEMLTSEFWNGKTWQKTDWDGNVKAGLERISKDNPIPDWWLVVTVDYHN